MVIILYKLSKICITQKLKVARIMINYNYNFNLYKTNKGLYAFKNEEIQLIKMRKLM